MKIHLKKCIDNLIIITATLAALYCICCKYYGNKTFIISYHRTGPYSHDFRGLCVEPEAFNKQMHYLSSRGYHTISLSELITCLKEKKTFPPKSFVITIDDGYENNFTCAFPVLQRYNFRATTFLHTGAIGQNYRYPRYTYPDQHLSKEQVRIMSPFIYFGSHTNTHPDLTEISDQDILAEFTASNGIIKRLTGTAPDTFCYPYGKHTCRVRRITQRVYNGACTTAPGLVTQHSDPYALPRFEFKEWKAMGPRDVFISFHFYLKTLLAL